MTVPLNETHDPARRSFVESANAAQCDFPIQNLPFGVFRPAPGAAARVGVAIGDAILDVAAAASSFAGVAADAARACAAPSLNPLMALGPPAWSALRLALSRALSATHGEQSLRQYLVPMAQAELELPVRIGDFTDFFASIFHATNTGRAFRPDNPLLPNYKYVPVAYHGRASSVRASGMAVRRPCGQRKRANETASYGPSRNLDFELELGFYIGVPSRLGETVPIARAAEHIFGFCCSMTGRRRYPGLGIPAARAVPGQEFRHDRIALGGDAGGAGAVPCPGVCAARRRSAAAAVSRRSGGPRPWRPRHHA
jgi:fumarylacetoacetase